MFGHLSRQNGAGSPAFNERGNTTRILLLVLLLVVAAGGYVFYFTDLIRPADKPAPPPAAQTAPVKSPIPPRPDQAAAPPAAAVAPPPAAPATPPAAAPQGQPAPQAKPAPPAQPPAKAAEPAKPAPAVAAAPAKAPPAPAASAKASPAPKPSAPAKGSPAPAPAAPAKTAAAQPAPAKKEAVPAKAPVKDDKAGEAKKGTYALVLGDVPDKGIADALAKLKKKGISPVKKQIVTMEKPMNRLFIDEFTEQERAEFELQQLRKITADAFLVASNGNYTLYAGSYYTDAKLKAALQRLEGKGMRPIVRKAKLPIKVARLTAGSFATSEEAGKASRSLQKVGLTARVIKTGT